MTKHSGSSMHRVPSTGAVEHGYPSGHLGHLTDHEEQALVEFKTLLEGKGLYKPGNPPSHDDPTLLRYLRARKWVPHDAYVQFSDTENFRSANEIDVLYDTIDIDSFEASRKLVRGLALSWRSTLTIAVVTSTIYSILDSPGDVTSGIPIYVFQIRHLDSHAVAKYEKSTGTTYSRAKTDGKTQPKLLRLFALYENLTRFVQPLSSECTDRPHPATPITLSTNIVDISHVSLRMFWNLKAHMQAASQLATAHYPETLDRIFIIGAPMFFSTVWGWIKRWFDPVTVSKIFILQDHDVLPVLTTFMDIKNIPKSYGGELEWDFFDEPAYDDEIQRICQWEGGHTTFPAGPVYWRPIDDGKRLECVAVGSKGGADRKERVCTVTRAYPPKSTEDTLVSASVSQTDDAPEGEEEEIFVTANEKPIINGEVPTTSVAALSIAEGDK